MSEMPDRIRAHMGKWQGEDIVMEESPDLKDTMPLYLRSTPAREAADEMLALLPEAIEGLEALAERENGDEALRGEYPYLQRRWERDMELPNKMRAILAKAEGRKESVESQSKQQIKNDATD